MHVMDPCGPHVQLFHHSISNSFLLVHWVNAGLTGFQRRIGLWEFLIPSRVLKWLLKRYTLIIQRLWYPWNIICWNLSYYSSSRESLYAYSSSCVQCREKKKLFGHTAQISEKSTVFSFTCLSSSWSSLVICNCWNAILIKMVDVNNITLFTSSGGRSSEYACI